MTMKEVRTGQVLARLVDDDYRAAVHGAGSEHSQRHGAARLAASAARCNTPMSRRARGVASTIASREQNQRDLARQHTASRPDSSSTEARERLETTHAQLEAQLTRIELRRRPRSAGASDIRHKSNRARQPSARLRPRSSSGQAQPQCDDHHWDGVMSDSAKVKPGKLLGVGAGATLTPLPNVMQMMPTIRRRKLFPLSHV